MLRRKGLLIDLQVLRDQGLGKYCDPEFVKAASREMQEAMDMTPEEFDAAAHQLLTAERDGTLRLPMQGLGALGGLLSAGSAAQGGAAGGASASGWGDEDEGVPLRSPGASYQGAPSHFTSEPQPGQGHPMAPSRRRRGGGSGGGPGGPPQQGGRM